MLLSPLDVNKYKDLLSLAIENSQEGKKKMKKGKNNVITLF